ncbi:MAG: MBL fold metallo-hydrolase [Lautropia sp.]|nr:MBL fold metallo-hydrolase [Lautropia sp.]
MKHSSARILRHAALVALLLTQAACSWQSLHPVFGGQPDDESRARIAASPQFDGQKFVNEEPTEIFTPQQKEGSALRTWLGKWWNAPDDKNPLQPLPSASLDAGRLQNGSFAWLGHSGVLFKTADKVLLTDPVFHRASPIPFPWLPLPLVAEPFALQHPLSPDELPRHIDAVLISHDHFDHLDLKTIQAIDARVGRYFVPLGVKAHLQRWGVASDKITEMDWHERAQVGSVELIMTPARHFSGRMSGGHFATLWSSWVVKSPELSIFINGDSGYGHHYARIGQQYGPFDAALIEIAGYDEEWAQIHLTPEEAATASRDLRAKLILPTHWARFDLAHHRWQEPIERLLAATRSPNQPVATPLIGEVFTLTSPPTSAWWRKAP